MRICVVDKCLLLLINPLFVLRYNWRHYNRLAGGYLLNGDTFHLGLFRGYEKPRHTGELLVLRYKLLVCEPEVVYIFFERFDQLVFYFQDLTENTPLLGRCRCLGWLLFRQSDFI